MKNFTRLGIYVIAVMLLCSCNNQSKKETKTTEVNQPKNKTAKDILGNPDYQAISFGGYRGKSLDIEPTLEELKEDMKILSAMNIKIIRNYKVHLPEATNILKAITELKQEDPNFEMYVMLGAWIDCKNAWTDKAPDHNLESEANAAQIEKAVQLANKYPDIVKIIAVGNEAMVKWAATYYVQPRVILKWVNYLQQLKKENKLSKDLWITSSDNFASWGGGDAEYHTEDLNKLIKAVDYVSMHTYPMHDTHYNPSFWGIRDNEAALSDKEKIAVSMNRAKEYAKSQYKSVVNYVHSIDKTKPVHIGETGWSSKSDDLFGSGGTKASDEYKEALYYNAMREWTNKAGLSCFYFEAFNEPWKDDQSDNGSENHFGLFTVEGKAKYVVWDLVDKGVFKGLTRNGNKITKTYNGDESILMKDVLVPPTNREVKARMNWH
jgi:exo-beta-1,3-glucanase (GH17 family)